MNFRKDMNMYGHNLSFNCLYYTFIILGLWENRWKIAPFWVVDLNVSLSCKFSMSVINAEVTSVLVAADLHWALRKS